MLLANSSSRTTNICCLSLCIYALSVYDGPHVNARCIVKCRVDSVDSSVFENMAVSSCSFLVVNIVDLSLPTGTSLCECECVH